MTQPLMVVRVGAPAHNGFSDGECYPVVFGMACTHSEPYRVKLLASDDRQLIPGDIEVGVKMGFTLGGLSVVVID